MSARLQKFSLPALLSGQRKKRKVVNFKSSIDLFNLQRLESHLTSLKSPRWPFCKNASTGEYYLPTGPKDTSVELRACNGKDRKIDKKMADQGQLIYAKRCQGCHDVIDRDAWDRLVIGKMIGIDNKQSTDKAMAKNSVNYTGKSGNFKDTYQSVDVGNVVVGEDSGTVIYRSKMHATLKRNFQVMPGTKWLELLIRHIPDKHEHLMRYYGAYSSRYRGEHKGEEKAGANTASVGLEIVEPDTESRRRARAAWAKLIYRVYEADPLVCPRCDAEMRVIAVIHDPAVIRRILAHLKLWEPRPAERGPPNDPGASPDWPVSAQLPLTYLPGPRYRLTAGPALQQGRP